MVQALIGRLGDGRMGRASARCKQQSVSLVEVSLSTVMELKDRAAPSFKSGCNTAAGRFASVKTKASMVAMSGRSCLSPWRSH
jgi:hypothetical protein